MKTLSPQPTIQLIIKRSIQRSLLVWQSEGERLDASEALVDEGHEGAGIAANGEQLGHLRVAQEVEASELVPGSVNDTVKVGQQLLLRRMK